MAKNEIEIVVDADTKKAEKKLKGFGKALGAVGDIAKNAIGVALGVGLTKIPGLVIDAIGSLNDLVDEAMEFDQARDTFDKLTDSIGESSDAMMVDLREATHGMVSDADLVLGANKLMAMGLADTADEAATLAGMAVELGTAMGEDASTAMENFALMLANESIPRLDSFGMSGATARKKIDDLIKSGEAASRSEAFKMVVLEDGAKAMDEFGNKGDTAKGGMDRFQAGIDNVKKSIGLALLEGFGPLAGKLIDFITLHLPDIQLAIGLVGDAFAVWAEEQMPKVEKFLAEDLGPTLEDAIQWLGEDLPEAIAGFGMAWDDIMDTLDAVGKVIGIIADGIQWLNDNGERFRKLFWGAGGEDSFQRYLDDIHNYQGGQEGGQEGGTTNNDDTLQRYWDKMENQYKLLIQQGGTTNNDDTLQRYWDKMENRQGGQQGGQEGGTTNNNFNWTINNPVGEEPDIITDFWMAQAMAGP